LTASKYIFSCNDRQNFRLSEKLIVLGHVSTTTLLLEKKLHHFWSYQHPRTFA